MAPHINLSSFAGGGKTTIAKILMAIRKVTVIPQITTRPRRPVGEGPEYLFNTEDEFRRLEQAGQLLVSKSLDGFHHGVLRQECWPVVGEDVELVLSMFGSQAPLVRQHVPNMRLVFIGFRDMGVLRERLRRRCSVDGSNFEDKWALNEHYLISGIEGQYDYVVYNDTTPEDCVEQILSLLQER